MQGCASHGTRTVCRGLPRLPRRCILVGWSLLVSWVLLRVVLEICDRLRVDHGRPRLLQLWVVKGAPCTFLRPWVIRALNARSMEGCCPSMINMLSFNIKTLHATPLLNTSPQHPKDTPTDGEMGTWAQPPRIPTSGGSGTSGPTPHQNSDSTSRSSDDNRSRPERNSTGQRDEHP